MHGTTHRNWVLGGKDRGSDPQKAQPPSGGNSTAWKKNKQENKTKQKITRIGSGPQGSVGGVSA